MRVSRRDRRGTCGTRPARPDAATTATTDDHRPRPPRPPADDDRRPRRRRPSRHDDGLTCRPRTRRNVELVLLLSPSASSCWPTSTSGSPSTAQLPPGLLTHGAGLLVISLAFHLVLRWRASYADPLLLPIVTLLNGLGLVMIHRLDIAEGRDFSEGLALQQLIWSALGVAIAAGVLCGPARPPHPAALHLHRRGRRLRPAAAAARARHRPHASTARGSGSAWARSPSSPARSPRSCWPSSSPATWCRPATRSRWPAARCSGCTLPRGRDLGPILVAWVPSLGVLVFEKDLGSSLLFFGLFVAMLYVATERDRWIAIGLVLFCAGAYVAYLLFGHVQARVLLWLHPFAPRPESDQLAQGLMGMAAGGLLGTGLGRGRPDLTYFAETDFIIPSFGEELGLVGLFALLVLYVLLVERGLRTAIGVRDGFGKLLAAGLAFSVALQCFVVVGGVTRVIPLTGLTMPFLSYGGSSLLANWALVALLLRISDQARRPSPSCPTASAPRARPRPRWWSCGERPHPPALRRRRRPVRALLVATTWIQFVQAKALQTPRQPPHPAGELTRERGPILVGGDPVARSVPTDDELKWLRTYPQGELYAHVTGYYSFIYGAGGGIEGAEDALLSGSSDKLFYRRVVRHAHRRDPRAPASS